VRRPAPLDPALREPVFAEQLRMVCLHSEVAPLIARGFAAVMALRLQGELAPGWAHSCFLLKLPWSGLRFLAGRRCARPLTATVTELGRAQCREVGMDDFLARPCTLEDVMRVLPQFGQRD